MKDTPTPKPGKYPSLSAKRVEQQPKKVESLKPAAKREEIKDPCCKG